MVSARQLRSAGVLGINSRNLNYIAAHNPRRLYPLVDDKLRTKALALAAGMAVPELFGVVGTQHDARNLHDLLEAREDFVIKPSHGSGGDGVLVVCGRRGSAYRRHDGTLLSDGGLAHHVSKIVSGQYSLSGLPDKAMIEYRVQVDPMFEHVTYQGVPDVRVVVYRGYPAMAMVRLPTRQSGGRANLHQGAVGVGIDLASGGSLGGVCGIMRVDEHPDTGCPLDALQIPAWQSVLELAARCHELTGLGLLGVDIVLDRARGPLILELNARPGLNIQIANGLGLTHRLTRIDQAALTPATPAERTHFVATALSDVV